MREKLKAIAEERLRFVGVFVRYGKKEGFRGRTQETLLLRDVRECANGNLVSDHLWFNLTDQFANLRLQNGDTVEFDARVKKYEKGYVNKLAKINNRKEDYRLSHPTNVKKV